MIQQFSDWLTYSIFYLNSASKVGSSINFFAYDTIKIYFLIIIIIGVIAFIRTFLPPHKIKETLSKQKFRIGNFAAAILGTILNIIVINLKF